MFVLNKFRELLWIDLSKVVEDRQIAFERFTQSRNQAIGNFLAERLHQKLVRVLDTTPHQQLFRRNKLNIFVQRELDVLLRNLVAARDRLGQSVGIVVG